MDSHHFRDALRHGHRIILDGGLATQLEAQGADLSDSLWSARLLIEEPEAIVAAHLAFYRAGANVATTASYQATFDGFATRGLDRSAAEGLLQRSVELAERAKAQALDEGVAGPLFVAASIGPYGAMLADGSESRGSYGLGVAQMADFHRDRLRVLAGTGADILAVETIPELEEAEAVAGLLGEVPGTAAWISFSCADGARLRSGAPPAFACKGSLRHRSSLDFHPELSSPKHIGEIRRPEDRALCEVATARPQGGEARRCPARQSCAQPASRAACAAPPQSPGSSHPPPCAPWPAREGPQNREPSSALTSSSTKDESDKP